MKQITLICPVEEGKQIHSRLKDVLEYGLNSAYEMKTITKAEELYPMEGERLFFAVDLTASGINTEYYRMLDKIRRNPCFFEDCIGCVLVDGASEFYTKSVGRELVYSANQAGCSFIGRPLVEGTGSLRNFQIQANLRKTDLMTAYHLSVKDLAERLTSFRFSQKEKPKLLVLHASNFRTSNTWNLWNMVKEFLDGFEINEMSLRNGTIHDCGGCPYTMCMHFSEKGQCYYGGTMVETVHPAVLECDALLLLCPNYNDAVSANIAAFINRLTSVYRKTPFFDKYLFGIIVSGYSGGDLVAEQLISGLNMNKAFILPKHFALQETANDPGSVACVEGIHEKAKEFAGRIKASIQAEESEVSPGNPERGKKY